MNYTIHHLDGNPNNNDLANLAWVDPTSKSGILPFDGMLIWDQIGEVIRSAKEEYIFDHIEEIYP